MAVVREFSYTTDKEFATAEEAIADFLSALDKVTPHTIKEIGKVLRTSGDFKTVQSYDTVSKKLTETHTLFSKELADTIFNDPAVKEIISKVDHWVHVEQ